MRDYSVEVPRVLPSANRVPAIRVLDSEGPSVPNRLNDVRRSPYEPLIQLALGNSYAQIGEMTGVRPEDVKNRLGMMKFNLGVGSNRAALEKLLSNGSLSMDQVLPEKFDPNLFTRFSNPKDRKIIEGIMIGADYHQLSAALNIPLNEIEERVSNIRTGVKAGNNFQIYVFGLGAKQRRVGLERSSIFEPLDVGTPSEAMQGEAPVEVPDWKPFVENGILSDEGKKILSLFAMGYREWEIAKLMGKSYTNPVRKSLQRITREMGAATYQDAIWKATIGKQINLQSLVSEDFDPRVVDRLTLEEKVFLQNMITSSSGNSSVDMSPEQFNLLKKSVCEKLDVERLVQAGIYFMESQRRANGGEVNPNIKRYALPKSHTRKSLTQLKIPDSQNL